MKIKKFVKDNKEELVLLGITIIIVGGLLILNNTEFIKGSKELMKAANEGRLDLH